MHQTQPKMKPGQFSFLGDDFENLFRYSDLFLPGIEKILGIFFSVSDNRLKILARKRDESTEDNFPDLLEKRESMIMIQKFRADSQKYAWIKRDDMPFDLPVRRISAPNIFTELENVILVLRFPNVKDGLHDLLFIHFNKNLGNFVLSKSDKQLSAENKSIIGYLLYHQFKIFLEMNLENLRLLRTFNHGVLSIIRSNSNLKDQLRQVQMNYGDSMVNLAGQYLAEFSARQDYSYAFTPEALEKIRNYQGNIRHLRKIIENAIVFTENLMTEGHVDAIQIEDYSLDFDSYQVSIENEQATRKIDSRHSRAMLLLEKLEKAASIVKGRTLPLTSNNVGKNMDPPITAPAITDALSKNKDMIRQLVSKYPEKWETVRKDFRPLLNVLRTQLPGEIKEATSA